MRARWRILMEHGVGRILDVFLVSFAIKIALLLGDFLQKARPWQHHIHLAISDQCLGAVLVSFGRRLGLMASPRVHSRKALGHGLSRYLGQGGLDCGDGYCLHRRGAKHWHQKHHGPLKMYGL